MLRSHLSLTSTKMFAVAEEVAMRLEEGATAAKLIRHASQRPHVAGEAPLQVQNDFWRAICSCCDQTSLRRGRARNTSKVDETEMIEVRLVVLRDKKQRRQRGQRQDLCRECPQSGRTSHSLQVRKRRKGNLA